MPTLPPTKNLAEATNRLVAAGDAILPTLLKAIEEDLDSSQLLEIADKVLGFNHPQVQALMDAEKEVDRQCNQAKRRIRKAQSS